MVYLQQRDFKLLRLCYEHSFITLEHAEYEFQGVSARAARQRVLELERDGYLVRRASPSLQRRFYYRLTKLGLSCAVDREAQDERYKNVNLYQFDHDSIVTSARQRLSRVWEGRFTPEAFIRPGFNCHRV